MINIDTKGKAAQEAIGELLEQTHHIGQYSVWNRNGRWTDCKDFCYWDSPFHELNSMAVSAKGAPYPEYETQQTGTKLVILDGYSVVSDDLSWGSLSSIADITSYDRTPAELVAERCKDAAIVLTNKVVIDEDIISKLPHLRYIGVLATGYNVVDLKAASKRGIIVTNIPAYSTESVVQMTWAHILNIIRSEPLEGKTLGVVGLGHIGMRVAEVGLTLGMRVIALTSKTSLPSGFEKISLDKLLSDSDVLTLHCPLSDSNKEMINKASLQRMKQGAVLINTGRGGLVNEQDVADALNSGKLRAYGTDVLSKEPPSASNPLLSARNCYITPHIAWATVEARQRLIGICIENVRAFLKGRPVNVVNQ